MGSAPPILRRNVTVEGENLTFPMRIGLRQSSQMTGVMKADDTIERTRECQAAFRQECFGQLGDVQIPRENQRQQLHSHLQRFRLNERSLAEGRIVGNGELLRLYAAAEDRKAEISHRYRTP